MDALVETHTEAEVEMSLSAGASLIGINNRDLATFEVDLETTRRLRPLVPVQMIPVVAESGIFTRGDVAMVAGWGVDAVLVGRGAGEVGGRGCEGAGPSVGEPWRGWHVTRFKVCGLRRVEDALAAIGEGAGFIGLIFAPSKRQLTADVARGILDEARAAHGSDRKMPEAVGVFVNASADEVNRISELLRAGQDTAAR